MVKDAWTLFGSKSIGTVWLSGRDGVWIGDGTGPVGFGSKSACFAGREGGGFVRKDDTMVEYE